MTRLPYVEQGDATGIPVLMLHGVTDSWRSFELVLPHLPDDIRVIAATQRGHGEAPKPDSGYLVQDMAGDAVELLDELGIERAVVVGHSMGSWVTQRIAIDHPDRLMGIVLGGSFTPAVARDPALAAELRALGDVPDPITYRYALEWQESTVAKPIDADQMDVYVGESLKVPARVWTAAFNGFAEIDQREELADVNVPALLAWGDRDAFIPRSTQDELLETLSDSRLEVYEGVGHALHWEQPLRFARDVAAFSRYSAALQLSR
ncbi:MAG TPA: alpha/beta hydrolase [Thermoleophilaceae bacterium]|nr:alpha/beta hydrolase [Thermoleophilaceae bacterium]